MVSRLLSTISWIKCLRRWTTCSMENNLLQHKSDTFSDEQGCTMTFYCLSWAKNKTRNRITWHTNVRKQQQSLVCTSWDQIVANAFELEKRTQRNCIRIPFNLRCDPHHQRCYFAIFSHFLSPQRAATVVQMKVIESYLFRRSHTKKCHCSASLCEPVACSVPWSPHAERGVCVWQLLQWLSGCRSPWGNLMG